MRPAIVTLFDFADAPIIVELSSTQSMQVYGLSAKTMLNTLIEFPALAKVFNREQGGVAVIEFIRDMPVAVDKIIAASTKSDYADARVCTALENMAIGTKVKLIEGIISATVGEEGIDPFRARLAKIASTIGVQAATTPTSPAATTSAQPSPSPLSAALHLDLPKSRLGPLRRAA